MPGEGFVGLVYILIVMASLAAIVWTYFDAKENSPHPAFLWTLVVFFAGFVGFLLYLLLGRGDRNRPPREYRAR